MVQGRWEVQAAAKAALQGGLQGRSGLEVLLHSLGDMQEVDVIYPLGHTSGQAARGTRGVGDGRRLGAGDGAQPAWQPRNADDEGTHSGRQCALEPLLLLLLLLLAEPR